MYHLLVLELLITVQYAVVVAVASLTVADPLRDPDSKLPQKTLKSFLEIAQKTIIDGSLEVLQVRDSSSFIYWSKESQNGSSSLGGNVLSLVDYGFLLVGGNILFSLDLSKFNIVYTN